MEKRAGLIWRVAVMLLVIISIAPVVALSGSSQADETPRPETYMNPFPQYMNNALVTALGVTGITGTSLESPDDRPVTDVQVQVQRNNDGFCWDATTSTWKDDPDKWNSALVGPPVGTCAVETWTTDQWAWAYRGVPAPANLDSGDTKGYTVRARAKNNANYVDLSPSQRTFWYDNALPEVHFNTIFPTTINSLTTITGTAGDAGGTVDQVRVQIRRGAAPPYSYWNGFVWKTGAANRVWLKAQGTNSWSISTTTTPPLPEWENGQTYRLEAQVSDKANNRFTITGSSFLFRKNLTTATVDCYIDPFPNYANSVTQFTGTSRTTSPQTIVSVRVQIRKTDGNVWWSTNPAGHWATGTVIWADCPAAVITAMPAYGQYDWTLAVGPLGITWEEGKQYQISAQATDDTLPTARTDPSLTETFVYDVDNPNSNINAVPGEGEYILNSWTSMTGVSGDTQGQIGAVIVLIQRVNPPGDNLYWNGAGWGAAPWGSADAWDWVFATFTGGTTSVTWRVTSSTAPALPPMVNDMNYHIVVHAMDKAGNEETTAIPAPKDFQFRMDLSIYTPPVPTATAGPAGTGGPTETGGPTTPPGDGDGGAHTAEPTATHQPTPTYTYVPPPHTTAPTATVLPGFSGSATIGPAGGKVTANNNDGSPRVTATFGANALSASADVSITGSGTCTGTAPVGYYFGNSCFDITPSQALGAMVKICVHYTAADLMAADGEEANLRLAYKDAEGNWKVLKTTLEDGTICAESDHLSSWAVVGKTGAVTEGWEWWYYVAIGIGAVVVVLLLVYLIARPRGKGGEGEEQGEGGYEEGEV